MEVYLKKARKIKSAYRCTFKQITDIKVFLVSLNSCDLFLSGKTWHIGIKIISNGSSKVSFVSLLRKKLFFHFYIIFWYHDFQAGWEKLHRKKMKNGSNFPNHDSLIRTLTCLNTPIHNNKSFQEIFNTDVTKCTHK